jgi:hypothetical protein
VPSRIGDIPPRPDGNHVQNKYPIGMPIPRSPLPPDVKYFKDAAEWSIDVHPLLQPLVNWNGFLTRGIVAKDHEGCQLFHLTATIFLAWSTLWSKDRKEDHIIGDNFNSRDFECVVRRIFGCSFRIGCPLDLQQMTSGAHMN